MSNIKQETQKISTPATLALQGRVITFNYLHCVTMAEDCSLEFPMGGKINIVLSTSPQKNSKNYFRPYASYYSTKENLQISMNRKMFIKS